MGSHAVPEIVLGRPIQSHYLPLLFWLVSFVLSPCRSSTDDENRGRMTLARREMAIILSTLLLRYDLYDTQKKGFTMELFNTIRERDVEARSDYIIPLAEEGSDGVQIKFRA